jgi:hypothetical protein
MQRFATFGEGVGVLLHFLHLSIEKRDAGEMQRCSVLKVSHPLHRTKHDKTRHDTAKAGARDAELNSPVR